MRVLLIGSGGREHALAWKLAQSPRLTKLYVAPGNGGTSEIAENVAVDPADHAAVIGWAAANAIDFVVIGPDAPVVADSTIATLPIADTTINAPNPSGDLSTETTLP